MEPMLEFKNVRKEFKSGVAELIVPLDGVNLSLDKGERVILLGKSGSGKTTLLNLAGGVDRASSGNVLFKGLDLSAIASEDLANYRRREVGFIFQSFNLFPTLTVGENAMLPLNLLGDHNNSKGREILDLVGLGDKWERFPEELSGGEQQRVAIARALIKKPSLILADEPTGNLDHETGADILQLIHKVCSETQAAMIMATHSTETLWLAQRKYRLIYGKLDAA